MKFIEQFKNTAYVSKEVIKLIWGTSRKYTIYTLFLLTCNSIVPITNAYLLKKVIDYLTLSLQQQINFNTILFFLIAFITITILSRFLESQRNATQVILGNLFQKEINQRIVAKTLKLDFYRFEDAEFHDKLDRTREHATWKPLNTFYNLFGGLQSIFILFSVFIVFYSLNPLILVLMIFFSIPGLLFEIKYGNIWWNLLYQEVPESRKLNYYQHLMTSSHEIKDIKLLNLKETLLSKYKLLYEKIFHEQKKVVIKKYFWELIAYLISDIVLVLFYIFLTWQTYIKKFSIGDFTFYSSLYLNGVGALHELVKNISGIYENNLFIKDLLEFFLIEEEKQIAGMKRPEFKRKIEFKNVWFKYAGSKPWILKGVSFKLDLGESVALVGENGAGKTTIVKLLTRLYEPTKGEILIDNQNIQKIDLTKYRNLFGVTLQDFAKFNFTVEENIKLGDVDRKIKDSEMIEASKKSHIYKKAVSLPKKFKTILGKWFHEGHEISYGEWQRLAIARTLIKKAPIYILDEPTAALDAKAEYLVFKEFQRHVKGKTALFISHRFSNVKLADEIIVLENGKIIERGSHSELIKKPGRYKQLYEFQAKRYSD